jgi:hypothetical protein
LAHDLYDGSGYGVVAKIFYNDLKIAKSEFLVNTFTQNSQTRPVIFSMANENFVIVWDSTSQDGFDNPSIFMQIFNEKGDKIGDEKT